MRGLGAVSTIAETLTITASDILDKANPGFGTLIGESFTLTATVSEPARFEFTGRGSGKSLHQIETLTAFIGPSVLSLTPHPSIPTALEIRSSSPAGASVNLLPTPGRFASPAGPFLGGFGARWDFDPAIEAGYDDTAAVDFGSVTATNSAALDNRTQSTRVSRPITAQSFTFPAPPPPAVIPLPAAGWLLLLGLGLQ
ncbi:MAG: hypothetical protein AAGI09_10480 [Pseudomonadota bacterium]